MCTCASANFKPVLIRSYFYLMLLADTGYEKNHLMYPFQTLKPPA